MNNTPKQNLHNDLRVSGIQVKTYLEKNKTVNQVSYFIDAAASAGSDLIVLPESFCGPYGNEYFQMLAEEIDHENNNGQQFQNQLNINYNGSGSKMLRHKAQFYKCYIAGGVIEKFENKLYNTVVVYNSDGKLIAKYRKIHLSRVSVGQDNTSESDILQAGDNTSVFEIQKGTNTFRIGIAICFDIRFQNLQSIYSQHKCDIMLYPSAFLYSTGELHWEILLRTRSLDGQFYSVAPNHSKDSSGKTEFYGNSMIVDPFGHILTRIPSVTESGCAVITADIKMDYLIDVRKRINLRQLSRPDCYQKVIQKNFKPNL